MKKAKRTFGDVQKEICDHYLQIERLVREFRTMLEAHGNIVRYNGVTYLVTRCYPLGLRGHIRLEGRRQRKGAPGFCQPTIRIGMARECELVPLKRIKAAVPGRGGEIVVQDIENRRPL